MRGPGALQVPSGHGSPRYLRQSFLQNLQVDPEEPGREVIHLDRAGGTAGPRQPPRWGKERISPAGALPGYRRGARLQELRWVALPGSKPHTPRCRALCGDRAASGRCKTRPRQAPQCGTQRSLQDSKPWCQHAPEREATRLRHWQRETNCRPKETPRLLTLCEDTQSRTERCLPRAGVHRTPQLHRRRQTAGGDTRRVTNASQLTSRVIKLGEARSVTWPERAPGTPCPG